MESVTPIVVALITLVGTLAGVLAGVVVAGLRFTRCLTQETTKLAALYVEVAKIKAQLEISRSGRPAVHSEPEATQELEQPRLGSVTAQSKPR